MTKVLLGFGVFFAQLSAGTPVFIGSSLLEATLLLCWNAVVLKEKLSCFPSSIMNHSHNLAVGLNCSHKVRLSGGLLEDPSLAGVQMWPRESSSSLLLARNGVCWGVPVPSCHGPFPDVMLGLWACNIFALCPQDVYSGFRHIPVQKTKTKKNIIDNSSLRVRKCSFYILFLCFFLLYVSLNFGMVQNIFVRCLPCSSFFTSLFGLVSFFILLPLVTHWKYALFIKDAVPLIRPPSTQREPGVGSALPHMEENSPGLVGREGNLENIPFFLPINLDPLIRLTRFHTWWLDCPSRPLCSDWDPFLHLVSFSLNASLRCILLISVPGAKPTSYMAPFPFHVRRCTETISTCTEACLPGRG